MEIENDLYQSREFGQGNGKFKSGRQNKGKQKDISVYRRNGKTHNGCV